MNTPSNISLPADAGDIVLDILAGRRGRYQEFEEKVIPAILGYLRSKYESLSDEECEDLFAMMMERLIRYPFKSECRGEMATRALSIWVTKTAYSCFVDQHKRATAAKRFVDPENVLRIGECYDEEKELCDVRHDQALSISQAAAIRKALEAALSAFDEKEREALRLVYVEGKSITRASKAVGLKISEMKNIQRSFKKELAEAFEYFQIDNY